MEKGNAILSSKQSFPPVSNGYFAFHSISGNVYLHCRALNRDETVSYFGNVNVPAGREKFKLSKAELK